MSKLTLKDLAVKHPYYCSDSNRTDVSAAEVYEDFKSFFDEYGDADIDMNLCFRFDLIENEFFPDYHLKIYIIQQRRGHFVPIHIRYVGEDDTENLIKYLTKHAAYANNLFNPITDLLI